MTCPACGAAIDAEAFCSWCGLDLQGADATRLRDLIAGLGDIERQMMALTAEHQTLAAELTRVRWSVTPEQAPVTPSAPPAYTAPRRPGGAEWTVDRVRSVLLWLGAALLAASALTFTAVAWSHLGDGGRATLLGAVTGVFTGLALALRRRLPATAEAFTVLSIGLVLIDWHALHRAGLGEGMSGTAVWAIGSLVAAAFASLLGTAVGSRTSRVAVAVLVPLSAELFVASFAGAPWSASLALALISASVVLAWRFIAADAEPAVRRVLELHALVTWVLAAGFAAVAAATTHTFAQALCPAAVVCTLALAPVAALHRRLSRDFGEMLVAVIVGVPIGALVTVVATSFGPQGLVAWATFVGCVVAVLAAHLAPTRWHKPAYVTSAAYALPGLAFAMVFGLVAALGPLGWFRDAWSGSLDVAARIAYGGARTQTEFDAGWPAVWTLAASAIALVLIAAKTRRGISIAVALAVLGIGLTPVVAGASALVTLIIATATTCVVLVAAAALDRSRPRLAIGVLPTVLLVAAPAAGWAAVTRDASITVLFVVAVVAVIAAMLALSDVMRVALAVGAGALDRSRWPASGRPHSTSGRRRPGSRSSSRRALSCSSAHTRAHEPPKGSPSRSVERSRVPRGSSSRPRHCLGSQARSLRSCRFWLSVRCDVSGPRSTVGPRPPLPSQPRGRGSRPQTSPSSRRTPCPPPCSHLWPASSGGAPVPARSWLTLGPALVIALGPTLAIGVANDDIVRTVACAVIAFAVVLFGAWKRLQAPLAIGAAALLVLAIDTFGPAAARLPEWVPLAAIGVLLMWIGATFERRREARAPRDRPSAPVRLRTTFWRLH